MKRTERRAPLTSGPVEHCRCGCHGAEPRPQFAPTPAAYKAIEDERDRWQALAKKLAERLAIIVDGVGNLAPPDVRWLYKEALANDPEVLAAMEEARKEREG